MKFKEYERPELEEIELLLEGSFLEATSIGVDKDDNETEGDDWD